MKKNGLDATARRAVGNLAEKAVIRFRNRSAFFDIEQEALIPRLSISDISTGEILGKGCFSHVYEVRILNEQEKNSAERLGLKCNAPNSSRCTFPYAIKHLCPTAMKNKKLFQIGSVDLAVEAQYLSCMQHEHIIKLHALSAQSISDAFSSGALGAYFLILDRLELTLQQKMKLWVKEEEDSFKEMSCFEKLRLGSSNRTFTLPQRLVAATSIASALQHLHQKNIMYRDLKPDNIGFDAHDTLKLFDFGLAKEIPPGYATEYKHTKMTGSLRYMSPEVARGLPYGLPADVYSFSILLWHLLSLEEPFAQHKDYDAFIEAVAYRMERPKSKKAAGPTTIHKLMCDSWVFIPSKRPTMDVILSIIFTVSMR